MSKAHPDYGDPLTDVERGVLVLIAEGYTNAEVSKRVFMSEDTVKMHTYRLTKKLGARSRTHAVWLGIKSGDLESPAADAPRPVPARRPEVRTHIAACFAAEACPCRRQAVAS